MSIIDHIQYLISRYDCVVVSGLGAFVAQYEPARLSADGRMLLPPQRSLVFNSVISHDDGLLVGSVARREGIGYEAAREIVGRDVEMLLRRIDQEGAVTLPRVGRLQRTAGAAIAFVPDLGQGAIVNAMYASLPMLAIASVASSVDPEPEILEIDLAGRRRAKILARLKPAAKYAAAVALLIAAGATLTTPALIDRTKVDQASLSIPKVTPAKPIVVEAPVADETAVMTEAEKNIVENPVVMVSDLASDCDAENYKCFVIVASCSSRNEAERYIALKKGKDSLKVLKSDGRYRVYAAVSNDYNAAFEFKSTDQAFASANPQAWVYTR